MDRDIVFPVPSVPEAIFGDFDWFLTNARYARLLSRAMISLSSPSALDNPKEYYLSVNDQLGKELESWRLSIPGDIRPGEHHRSTFSQGSSRRTAALWTNCFYNSFQLGLSRAKLHLMADDAGGVDVAQQEECKSKMLNTSRSTIEQTANMEVAPYIPLWYFKTQTPSTRF